jgi:CBS domain-containing protein
VVTVKDLLKRKGRNVWSIDPDKSVYDALMVMAEKQVGALVVREGKKIVGMISERDYARKVILVGRSSRGTSVADIMTNRVYYVSPSHSINDCMALMSEMHIRHLPVLDDGELAGIISIGDVVKSIISEQSYIIRQLESYITGR